MIGVICWLPPHKPDRKRFPPAVNFRAFSKFTSKFPAPDVDALVNYSPYPIDDQNTCFNVRLHYAFLEENEIKRLIKYCEVILMDSYQVIAVCRNIALPDKKNIFLEDEWIK